MSPRLFVGISPPDDVRDAICAFINTLKAHDRGALRVTSYDNLHLTIKFIGETDERRIPDIEDALSRIQFSPFTLTVYGAGGFPEITSDTPDTRILWTGIRRSAPLTRLAEMTEHELAVKDFPRDTRPYIPHFTIARARGNICDEVIKCVQDNSDIVFGQFDVDAIYLYKSESAPEGVRYTKLSRYGLKS
jgi:2'-5' RNA ligase